MNHELQGVEELEQIFPLYSRSDLARILSENGTNMELTIDAIFALEASKESASLQTPPTPTQPMPNELSTTTQSSSYRGTKCLLPDDFLRVPEWKNSLSADEQIAMMLQSQMYSRQQQQATQGNLPAGFVLRSIDGMRRRPPTQSSGQEAEAIPDLGILKTLNSVGDAAKRNFGLLATKFTAMTVSEGGSKPGSQSTNTNETGSLVHQSDDEEEIDEVISFDDAANNCRTTHVLDTTGTGTLSFGSSQTSKQPE